jgi:hypothetical protein
MSDLCLKFSVGNAKRRGKIFEAGLYPDKGIDFTPEKIKQAIENTTFPVPITHNHLDAKKIASIFDGKLGQLTKAFANEDYTLMFGESEWPEWVEVAIPNKTVSLLFDAETLAIKSCSLVPDPRVKDAALSERLAFSYDQHFKKDDEDMSFTKDEFKTWISEAFASLTPQKVEDPPKEEPKEEPKVDPAFSKENELLKQQLEAFKNEKALAFSTAQLDAGKIVGTDTLTVEQQVTALKNRMLRAQADDERDLSAGIAFSAETPSRVAELEQFYKNMVPLGKDGEQLQQGEILFSGASTEDEDAEYKRIMGKGPLGRAVLGKENK